MLLIKTLHIGCDNNDIAKIDNSEIEYISHFRTHTYNEMIYYLGKSFFKVQRLQSKGLIDNPYKLSIIFPTIEKFKESDTETNLDRWEFICNNFIPTVKGMIISFYLSEVEEDRIQDLRGAWYNWPYKDKWISNKRDDYVVIQDVSEVVNQNIKKDADKEVINGYLKSYKKIIKELESLGIKYEIVNYSTPIEKLFQLLSKCKLHITHAGGSYYIAAGMNTPTLNYGPNSWNSSKLINVERPGGFKTNKKMMRTTWGESHLRSWSVFHYDKVKGIYQKEQSYIKNIGMVEDEDYLELKRRLIE